MSAPNFALDRAEIDAHFKTLARLLDETPLPTEAGGTRIATADEFMLMHVKPEPLGFGQIVGFKHHDTRNYIFVLHLMGGGGWGPAYDVLHVPRTEEPFMRGFFDVFTLPADLGIGGCAPTGCACEPDADPRND